MAGTNNPGLDVRGVSLKANGDKLEATIQVTDPTAVGAAAQAIGAPFTDFVVRWEYQSKLYFAAAEYNVSGGTPTFFDGASTSIDLCSVSACDPHLLSYPGPDMAPNTSHATTGTVTNADSSSGAPGTITIDVPRADVGGPKNGERIDSVGAYSLVSLLSFDAPLPNPMAESDMVPVEVDGACCFTPFLSEGVAGTITNTFSIVGGWVAGVLGASVLLVRRRRATAPRVSRPGPRGARR